MFATTLSLFFKEGIAQLSVSKQHTFSAGVSYRKIDDYFLDVHVDKLLSTDLKYSYGVENGRSKKVLLVSGEIGHQLIGDAQARFYAADLSYSAGYAIQKNKTSAFKNYLGYAVAANSVFLKEGGNYSWASTTMLALYNSAVYSWKKSSLALDINIPALGFVSRPMVNTSYPSATDGMVYNSFSNLYFSSFHNQQAFSAELQFRHSFNRRWQILAATSFEYRKITESPSFLQQAYKITAGIAYRLW